MFFATKVPAAAVLVLASLEVVWLKDPGSRFREECRRYRGLND